MHLDDIRKTIDSLDAEIIALLARRIDAGVEAAEAKRKLGLPLHDPAREKEVLDRVAALAGAALPAESTRNIYRAIMAETLEKEQTGPNACAGRERSGKIDTMAVVLENELVAPGFHRMRLKVPALAEAFAPGQFFQLRLDAEGEAPFLRRPFAPSEMHSYGLSFVYAVVGEGTRRLAALPRGTEVGLLAPLGTAYTLLPRGASALIVGGGCGAPSLAPLARRLHRDGVGTVAIVGARSENVLLEHQTFARYVDRLLISTDDGTSGCKGTVMDALTLEPREALPEFDRVYACGPLPMLRATAAMARDRGIDCEVSLEERMACGFGACVGCVVPCRGTEAGTTVYRRVCHDGPVFNAENLAWEDMR